jgi:hypothetical protein
VTADHQKVVHPQEDLKVDLLEDPKVDLQEAVILTDPAMTREPHVDLEHLEQNQAIVFQESASHTIQKVASVSPIKAEIVNHLIATTAKVVSAVHLGIASHTIQKAASVNLIKEESVNRLTATTAKVVSANRIKEEIANRLIATIAKVVNANLLAELKIQHVHLTKEIIAGIAMRPLK